MNVILFNENDELIVGFDLIMKATVVNEKGELKTFELDI